MRGSCASTEGADPGRLKFFMYEPPELNHNFLRACARYRELRSLAKAENTAEVGMARTLARYGTHHIH